MSEVEGRTEGRVLADRYRLGDVLGKGGMGTVWRAVDETLGRSVAVKELRFPGDVDEDEKRRLVTRTLREAKATARIRNTGAITVFDVVKEDDRPWIVMELVEGRSLADVIRDDGPLEPRRAAEVGLVLLDVLRAAHAEGILHRDVKPSNVLIADGGSGAAGAGGGRVVLGDFGIAQIDGDPSVTSTGMLVGAPSYISPERARGHKPGPPADLWSLGALLYAAVEGRPPYDKGSAIATLTAVMTEPVGPMPHAGPLAEVIRGLLDKDPERRLDEPGARALLTAIVNAPERPAVPPARSGDDRTMVLPAGAAGAAAGAAGAASAAGAAGAARAPGSAGAGKGASGAGTPGASGAAATAATKPLDAARTPPRPTAPPSVPPSLAGPASAAAAGSVAEPAAPDAPGTPSGTRGSAPAAPGTPPVPPSAPPTVPHGITARSGQGPLGGIDPARIRAALGSVRRAAAKARPAPEPGTPESTRRPAPSSLTDVVPRRTLIIAVAVLVLAILGTVIGIAVANSGGGDGGSDKPGTGKPTPSATRTGTSGAGTAATGGDGKNGAGKKDGATSSDDDTNAGRGKASGDDSGDDAQSSGATSGAKSGPGKGNPAAPGSAESLPAGWHWATSTRFHFAIGLPAGWRQTGTTEGGSGAIFSANGGYPRSRSTSPPRPARTPPRPGGRTSPTPAAPAPTTTSSASTRSSGAAIPLSPTGTSCAPPRAPRCT
ncbi:protein kinase domain-containing protein [Actinacidiphila sp. DG2A-62]|uniref:serine/threonine-protein kinase n=1 Tax=Actinacidiphila sp. DG2A-62 TaxID=3108821 RepID=UPI003FA3AE56